MEVVHRDLKPSNVMLVPDSAMPGGERVKVLDFGIAKLPRDGAGPAATRTGTSMGTPEYMAPEQCQEAAQVDDKADVYSLGVMLFEMLAGQLPFIATNTYTLMYMHVNKPPPQLSRVAPGIPDSLGALVNRMLAKSPTVRPPMSAVAAALMADITLVAPVPTVVDSHPYRLPRRLLATGGLLFLGCLMWLVHFVVTSGEGGKAKRTPPSAAKVTPHNDTNHPDANNPSINSQATPQSVVPIAKDQPLIAAPVAPAASAKLPVSGATETKVKPPASVASKTEEYRTSGGRKSVTGGPRTSLATKQTSSEPPVTAVGSSKIKYDLNILKD